MAKIITNQNKLSRVYTVIFVMLFQLSSSLISVLATPQNNPLTICTAQGYKQIPTGVKPKSATTDDCFYCLFNCVALDTIDKNLDNTFTLTDNFLDTSLLAQVKQNFDFLSESSPIRAPPLL